MIDREEFYLLCDKFSISMNQSEMDAILAVFDRDGDGKIDFKEFQDIVGSYLLPPSTDGMSLSFQLDHRPQRPQGRRPISRSGLTTALNNNYRQMLEDVTQ